MSSTTEGYAMPRWIRICVAVVSLVGAACSDSTNSDGNAELGERQAIAAELSESWCVETQRRLASLPNDTQIDEDLFETLYDFVRTKTSLDPAAARPIGTVTYLAPVDGTSGTIAGEARCKMRSADGITAELEIGSANPGFTCQARNAEALAWATERLTSQELARYQSRGVVLELDADRETMTGSDWNEEGSTWARSDEETVRLRAAMLQSAYDSDDPDGGGVYYCKLLTPSFALEWMLDRAFWEDPIAGSDPAADIRESRGECEPTYSTPGSCIFKFQYTGLHFCSDYSGTEWTLEAARTECTERTLPDAEAVFSKRSCADRSEETDQLDGDGTYYGQCAILCGHGLETRWNQYSLVNEAAAADTCRGAFFEPDGSNSD